MSTTLGVGVPVPKMLPITGTWTLPFAAYLIYLQNRIVARRLQKEKYMGDRWDSSDASTSNANPDPLLLETRAHINFIENVPLAFILAAVAELNGANRKTLNWSLAALLVLRVAHVELGLRGENTVGWGRPIGFWGTQVFIGGVAGWCGYLVKGYWGYQG